MCCNKNVRLLITRYSYFEEVYLSYDKLIDLYSKDGNDRNILEILIYVKKCIDSNIEYFNLNNKYVKYIISLRKNASLNSEHFADALLYIATSQIKHGLFMISKTKSSKHICWITDCNYLQTKHKVISKGINYYCDKCKFELNGCNTIQKLLDIEHNSILNNASVKFEDFNTL